MQRKILEQKIKKWTKEGKSFTQVVDPLNFSEKPLKRFDITNASHRDNHPEALVINWITPMGKENTVGQTFMRGYRPGMMTHPFGWVNLVIEIPSYERREAGRSPHALDADPTSSPTSIIPAPVKVSSSDVNAAPTFTDGNEEAMEDYEYFDGASDTDEQSSDE